MAVHVYAKYPIRSGVYLGDESICPGGDLHTLLIHAASLRTFIAISLCLFCGKLSLATLPLLLVMRGSAPLVFRGPRRRLWWDSAAPPPPHRPVTAHVLSPLLTFGEHF